MNGLPLAELILTEFSAQERARAVPRHRRLYEAIRAGILSHRLHAGAKLPSTRDLARDLGLSRNTVLTAFEQLLAEGYVAARAGSGTFVANTMPDAAPDPQAVPLATAAPTMPADAIAPIDPGSPLSARGTRLVALAAGQRFEIQPFAPGDADFSIFPFKLWQRLQSKYWRDPRPELMDYGSAGGYLPLRRALADYLRVSRSVRVQTSQVLITAGTQQSLALCAQILADAGDTVWMEDPGYWGARSVFEASGLSLRPVPVDAEGMHPQPDDRLTSPRLIYLTPSHQYPKSVVMSLSRRRLLLDLAARKQAWILEDDYDSEFRYAGRPISSLQGLDVHERVVYLGTFSKVLYPGIKVGYLVVPPALVGAFQTALYDLQRPGQMMVQAALADFIEGGYFATHIRRIRTRYGEKRELLGHTLGKALGRSATLSTEESGLHLVIQLPPSADDEAIARQAEARGLMVRPLSSYYVGPERERGLVVGYAYVAPENIVRFGTLLGQVVKSALRRQLAG